MQCFKVEREMCIHGSLDKGGWGVKSVASKKEIGIRFIGLRECFSVPLMKQGFDYVAP